MANLIRNAAIDELGEALILDFTHFLGYNTLPRCVDIEGFLTEYLRCPVLYVPFGGRRFDQYGFISDGITPVSVLENGVPYSRIYPHGTILIDQSLLSNSESSRRRFTLAHEAGHYLLDLMDHPGHPPLYHKEFDPERFYTIEELRSIFNRTEAQADRMAAALLMPASLVRSALNEYAPDRKIRIYGSSNLTPEDNRVLQKAAGSMGVSLTALLIRIKTLGLAEYRPISAYVQYIRNGGS